VQPRPRISIQQRRTILRAENDVDDDEAEGLRHGVLIRKKSIRRQPQYESAVALRSRLRSVSASCSINARQRTSNRQQRAPYQPGASPQDRVTNKTRAESPIHHAPATEHGSGFQPSVVSHHESWGVAPGWYGDGPLALLTPR
jgi:hypothetical protein